MPVEELTSSIDRYQSAHSAAGVPHAFAIGAAARPVRLQTFGVRPQSYGAPTKTPSAHSVRPSTPRFNSGTSGAGRGSNSLHTFVLRKRCFECGSTTHFRHNCPQLLGKTTPKSEASVSRVGVCILRNDPAPKEQSLLRLRVNRVIIMALLHCLIVMPSVNGCDLEEPKFDSVVLQNVTAELSSLNYVDICLSGDDSRDVKRVSALCDTGAEICVANSSVVGGIYILKCDSSVHLCAPRSERALTLYT